MLPPLPVGWGRLSHDARVTLKCALLPTQALIRCSPGNPRTNASTKDCTRPKEKDGGSSHDMSMAAGA